MICATSRRNRKMKAKRRSYTLGKIEKGIPLPPSRSITNGLFRSSAKVVHHISRMKPGDSFTVSIPGTKFYGAAYAAAKALKVKVEQRRLSKDKVRVWRTK